MACRTSQIFTVASQEPVANVRLSGEIEMLVGRKMTKEISKCNPTNRKRKKRKTRQQRDSIPHNVAIMLGELSDLSRLLDVPLDARHVSG